jgi:outer membrane murein-binding lipoprotein Lpp
MNARFRESDEVQVTNKEALEAKIDGLTTGMGEVRTDVRELRADNKALRNDMNEGFRALDAKIEQRTAVLTAGQQTLREKMEEGFRAQDAKVTKLSEDVAGMRGLQKAILWVIGGVGTFASLLFTAAKALHWF